jgi:hypothetical protein
MVEDVLSGKDPYNAIREAQQSVTDLLQKKL